MIQVLLKKYWFPLVVLVLIVILAFLVNRYRDNATEYKKQRDEKTQALSLAKSTINDMQVRQRDVAALDEKYTKELADARENIDQLERDVAAGRKRLQISARCPTNGATTAATPTITADAERDYWRLRAGIETVTKQVGYLQDYINKQCLK